MLDTACNNVFDVLVCICVCVLENVRRVSVRVCESVCVIMSVSVLVCVI